MTVVKPHFDFSGLIEAIKEYSEEVGTAVVDDATLAQQLAHITQFPELIGVLTKWDILDKTPAGFAVVSLEALGLLTPVCHVSKFYIRKKYRGRTYARELVKDICDWAQQRGSTAVYAGSASELDSSTQYENLLARSGFTRIGSVMKKEF